MTVPEGFDTNEPTPQPPFEVFAKRYAGQVLFLKEHWAEGGDDEISFVLSMSGGSLILDAKKGEDQITEQLDIRTLLDRWVTAIKNTWPDSEPRKEND